MVLLELSKTVPLELVPANLDGAVLRAASLPIELKRKLAVVIIAAKLTHCKQHEQIRPAARAE